MMKIKKMLKVLLKRGPRCSCPGGCRNPVTFALDNELGYLCDEHTYITSRITKLKDADQIREIIRFLEQFS